MIRAIDKAITGLFQALVNCSQRKPMWWGEHCAYLYLTGIGLRIAAGNSHLPAWAIWVLCLGALYVAAFLLCVSRVPAMWATLARDNRPVWRMTFAALSVDALVRVCITQPTMGDWSSCCLSMALMAYHYFLECKDPPPPRPRHKMAMQGSGA